MKDQLKKEVLLSQLMQKSGLEMPFADFEDTLMKRIEKISIESSPVSHDQKWSFIFFILGTCLGLLLNSLLEFSQLRSSIVFADTIVLVFQAIFVLLFLSQFEKHLSFIKQWMKRERA